MSDELLLRRLRELAIFDYQQLWDELDAASDLTAARAVLAADLRQVLASASERVRLLGVELAHPLPGLARAAAQAPMQHGAEAWQAAAARARLLAALAELIAQVWPAYQAVASAERLA